MATWSDVEAAAPELAATVRARFEAHGMGLLATLRRDVSRISGIEPLFALGELYLGMMPGSLKAADVVRDARFALHSATTDKNVTEGDAKVSGSVVAVVDDDEFARFGNIRNCRSGQPIYWSALPKMCSLSRVD